jgi:hypothetical protein
MIITKLLPLVPTLKFNLQVKHTLSLPLDTHEIRRLWDQRDTRI